MSLARFAKECPGLVGSITRLFGQDVADQIAKDYCVAADLGGNVEDGLTREEGVSFNPRIARIASLVIQECDSADPSLVRVAIHSAVPSDVHPAPPSEVANDVKAVRTATSGSEERIQGVSLVLMLDRVRHLHMIAASLAEKQAFLDEVRSSRLLLSESNAPERLRIKVRHAVELQARRLSEESERTKP